MDKTQLIMVVLILALGIGSSIYCFIKMSKEQKIKNLKQWLKYAVVIAEKELGAGTGQIKLRAVYDAAVKQFPWIVSLTSFDMFSKWVDEALEWMKLQIETNKSISMYINK